MNRDQVWTRAKQGMATVARWKWRAIRLTAAWMRRKAAKVGIGRQIAARVRWRYELLLQIGRIVCARHRASPLQDGELAPLCQNAVDLDSEIKGLRQGLAEIMAAPLLPEDLPAEPLGEEPAQSAPD